MLNASTALQNKQGISNHVVLSLLHLSVIPAYQSTKIRERGRERRFEKIYFLGQLSTFVRNVQYDYMQHLTMIVLAIILVPCRSPVRMYLCRSDSVLLCPACFFFFLQFYYEPHFQIRKVLAYAFSDR